jgi:hypothetical protein
MQFYQSFYRLHLGWYFEWQAMPLVPLGYSSYVCRRSSGTCSTDAVRYE